MGIWVTGLTFSSLRDKLCAIPLSAECRGLSLVRANVSSLRSHLFQCIKCFPENLQYWCLKMFLLFFHGKYMMAHLRWPLSLIYGKRSLVFFQDSFLIMKNTYNENALFDFLNDCCSGALELEVGGGRKISNFSTVRVLYSIGLRVPATRWMIIFTCYFLFLSWPFCFSVNLLFMRPDST